VSFEPIGFVSAGGHPSKYSDQLYEVTVAFLPCLVDFLAEYLLSPFIMMFYNSVKTCVDLASSLYVPFWYLYRYVSVAGWQLYKKLKLL
jgi:hypothetical protein